MVGSQKELAGAHKRMTYCTIPAQHKGHCHQGQGKNKAVPRTQKKWTFGTRRWAKPEGIDGIKNQGLRQQLHLRKERTTSSSIRGRSRRQELHLGSRTTLSRIFRKALELEITKQIIRTSIRLQKMRGWPPPKRKKRLLKTA
jgi:hypothetical protein